MNTIDFNIFIFALVVQVEIFKVVMAVPVWFFYVPWHCASFYYARLFTAQFPGLAGTHTKVGWEGVAFLFRPFGRLDPRETFVVRLFLPLTMALIYTSLCVFEQISAISSLPSALLHPLSV